MDQNIKGIRKKVVFAFDPKPQNPSRFWVYDLFFYSFKHLNIVHELHNQHKG